MPQIATRGRAALKLVIVTTCPEPWGGSEELWFGAAVGLLERGHEATVFKTVVDFAHLRMRRLKELGCDVVDLQTMLPPLMFRLGNRLMPGIWRRPWDEVRARLLVKALLALRPDLVVISQGENFDGIWAGNICQQRQLPYVIICQKAAKAHWPHDLLRPMMKVTYETARRCYFVAEQNRAVTEEQIGVRLRNAEVVSNPFMTAEVLAWPAGNGDELRLACVGRMFPHDKGQDILLRTLALEKWRARDLQVSFFGGGANEEGLRGMAVLHGLRRVSFRGFTGDLQSIWREHHGLILASRCEGTPLVLVEAMMSGRPGVVTRVGGSADLVEDGVTGFLADSASVDALDRALENAWNRRSELPEIGRKAAERIRQLVPPDPSTILADKLLAAAGFGPKTR